MTAKGLRIASNLTLPIDAVTETFWFLGKRGSGKTHNCSVFVEEMLRALAQVVILDPMRAWYGLRSSVDGKSEGIPIAIFGGPYGDAPLEPSSGQFMAELAVRERVSMILDVKDWSKASRCKFVTAFLTRLLEVNEDAMHVVLEEAARFAPQRPITAKGEGNETAMLGACMDLVQLGRGLGLGASLISQRSATINNEVSTQTSVLVAHRTVSPSDRKAARGWFEFHESDAVDVAMDRLPRLPTGSALIASTELFDGDTLEEVTFRPRTTFDSSATPKVGQAKRVARTFADIDMAVIQTQMAEAIERAKATDPKELNKRIAELEREVREAKAAPPVIETTAVEVEVVRDVVPAGVLAWVDQARAEARQVASAAADLQVQAEKMTERASDLEDRFVDLALEIQVAGEAEPVRRELVTGNPRPSAPKSTYDGATPAPPVTTPRRARPETGESDGSVGKAEKRVLSVLAQYRQGRRNNQLALLAGYSWSGGFRNILSSLRTKGYIDGANSETMRITDAGVAALGDYDPLPTGKALLDYWLDRLAKGEAAALAHLADVYPREVVGPDLATATGYEFSGGFRNILSKLRTLDLIVGANTTGMRAADIFFER